MLSRNALYDLHQSVYDKSLQLSLSVILAKAVEQDVCVLQVGISCKEVGESGTFLELLSLRVQLPVQLKNNVGTRSGTKVPSSVQFACVFVNN